MGSTGQSFSGEGRGYCRRRRYFKTFRPFRHTLTRMIIDMVTPLLIWSVRHTTRHDVSDGPDQQW
jgi:hypothetical protein